jgi:hypothetical protein
MNLSVRPHSDLLPLPAPHAAPPFKLPSGHVALFQDASWASDRFEISTEQWPSNIRHNLAGHLRNRKAAWVAFNLPVGRVMTLTRHHRDVEAGVRICDLRDVAQLADLVGTGQTEAVDLASIGLPDAISSLFWRDVDLSMGAIELYCGAGFTGNRTVLFLSEWPRGELHTLSDWVIEDWLGSSRWSTMPEAQYCDLFQHRDGIGKQYPRMSGWQTGRKEAADTRKYSLNDMVAAFRWDTLVADRLMTSQVFMDILPNPLRATEGLMRTYGVPAAA